MFSFIPILTVSYRNLATVEGEFQLVTAGLNKGFGNTLFFARTQIPKNIFFHFNFDSVPSRPGYQGIYKQLEKLKKKKTL